MLRELDKVFNSSLTFLCWQGVVVCLHRKMMPQEFYFLSSEKYRPTIFGIPIVVSCSATTSGRGKHTYPVS